MADISMCLNKNCPLRMGCYRFTAKANSYRQSYSSYRFEVKEREAVCMGYWEAHENRKNKSKI